MMVTEVVMVMVVMVGNYDSCIGSNISDSCNSNSCNGI